MIREATAAIEEEMRLNVEKYKACLTRVETERAALDDKLAQRDAEITKLSSILEELKLTAETQVLLISVFLLARVIYVLCHYILLGEF